MSLSSIAILGTVGIPANYGGFETLAENLARFRSSHSLNCKMTVYCSSYGNLNKPINHLGADLQYICIKANGIWSIFYDVASLFSAVFHRNNVILLLGVSGAIALPLVRLLSHARIITNVDGIEWKRDKWNWAARWFLRLSERMAVRYSHEVVADNLGIADHIQLSYGRNTHVIAYGGDHALMDPFKPYTGDALPQNYALALCRVEPENNVAMILEAFSSNTEMPLVFVGNWTNSAFGRNLKAHFADHAHLHLLDPIYDVGALRWLRKNAAVYIHGHSAGGTNPSLVEMMHFGIPILAYDCTFNRYTTENAAVFFKDARSLCENLKTLYFGDPTHIGHEMQRIAQKNYTWEAVGKAYFDLLMGYEF